jgi:hypothetical protein
MIVERPRSEKQVDPGGSRSDCCPSPAQKSSRVVRWISLVPPDQCERLDCKWNERLTSPGERSNNSPAFNAGERKHQNEESPVWQRPYKTEKDSLRSLAQRNGLPDRDRPCRSLGPMAVSCVSAGTMAPPGRLT